MSTEKTPVAHILPTDVGSGLAVAYMTFQAGEVDLAFDVFLKTMEAAQTAGLEVSSSGFIEQVNEALAHPFPEDEQETAHEDESANDGANELAAEDFLDVTAPEGETAAADGSDDDSSDDVAANLAALDRVGAA